jgi:uncharacterized protein (DUF2147 family)
MNDPRQGAAALALALAFGGSAHAAADPAFGDWLTAARDGKVRIAPCEANPAQACGALVWFKLPPGTPAGPPHDAHNPDPALRSRPLMGLPIVSGFRRESPGRWADGRIYDPNDGKTYRSKMNVAPDGTLKVAGCILMFCQTQTWTKAP